VRDRDYEQITHLHIFCYDFSCLEMMLISNDNTFKQVYSEYYNDSYTFYELRGLILVHLKFLSLIRKHNEIRSLGIKIRGLSIHNTCTTSRLNGDTYLNLILLSV
jgi:hypothetical protein